MLPSSSERVTRNTATGVNQRLRREAENRVADAVAHPSDIDARIRALEREWDVERVLEANAATLALAGVVLGATTDKRWLLLSGAVAGFLLQHALQGWCPPLPVLRRLGFRTAREIGSERFALKLVRGDFDDTGVFGAGAGQDRARRISRTAQGN